MTDTAARPAPPVVGPATPAPDRPGWDEVQRLGAAIWAWRTVQAPRSRDDIPRLERPVGWQPDFSVAGVAAARTARDAFHAEWRAIDLAAADTATRVDHALLGSVLARVHWELDVVRSWQRDPSFWVDQTLGLLFDVLLPPPPFTAGRVAELRHLLAAVPGQVETARTVLAGHAERELAAIAVDLLSDVGARLAATASALAEVLEPAEAAVLHTTAGPAGAALERFAEWLRVEGPGFAQFTPVGRDAFTAYLRDVALASEPLAWMVDVGRIEYARAVTMETVATAAAVSEPLPELPVEVAAHVAAERRADAAMRQWYDARGLLTVPPWVGSYAFAPLPPWLAPLAAMGVTDDLLGPSRLGEDAVSYSPHPAPDLPFFDRANLLDPRLGVAHEGVHAVQLAWSWAHPDPVRRWYYDSLSNEGIAFYDEEMLLDSGLWHDAPHSRVVIARFLRLRALRVEVDVGLATGDLSIEQAAGVLRERVPLDEATALEEAAFFASTPGQALTYLVGKAQIQALLTDVAADRGSAFDLRTFHDRLWAEGNVPIALQRWELLGTPPAGSPSPAS